MLLWQTHTNGYTYVANRLVLNNYGILTLLTAEGTKVWRSSYIKRYDSNELKKAVLRQGHVLNEGEHLESPNRLYKAVFQTDGNFCLIVYNFIGDVKVFFQ